MEVDQWQLGSNMQPEVIGSKAVAENKTKSYSYFSNHVKDKSNLKWGVCVCACACVWCAHTCIQYMFRLHIWNVTLVFVYKRLQEASNNIGKMVKEEVPDILCRQMKVQANNISDQEIWEYKWNKLTEFQNSVVVGAFHFHLLWTLLLLRWKICCG